MTTATFSQPYFRFAASLPSALITTLALMFLMHTLISSDLEAPVVIERRPVDVVMPDKTIETQINDNKPTKVDEPAEQPQTIEPALDLDPNEFGGPKFGQINLGRQTIEFGGSGSIDGEFLPIVKVEPRYPRRALSRGIEAWVIVEFTVTTSGAVRNVVVAEAQPQNIFDQAAIKAAQKFKYKPRVLDGVAVEVAGVQNKITFAIANN